nr:DUF1402 family protein [uncultured Cohaesibacter sp.]
MKFIWAVCFAFLAGAFVLSDQQALAKSVQVVPSGNRQKVQPKIPNGSHLRTKAQKLSFEKKYDKVHALLQKDKKLLAKIKDAADVYSIDPIHMIGAIVGEHTYNINVFDYLQTYYTKAAIYSGMDLKFAYDGEDIESFLKRPQFEACDEHKDSYALWSCRQAVWKKDFQGKEVDGKTFPKDRFSKVFFQPIYAGQTFGLGQISPLTALKLSDLVHKKSGIRKLDANNAAGVYNAIMKPDISLAFMAAMIRKAIDDYRSIAGVDISQNPGITATLYNIGDSDIHARELRDKRKKSGRTVWPQENYYGWLVNDKAEELVALVDEAGSSKKRIKQANARP